MRRYLRQLIPSMYFRRLLLLSIAAVLTTTALGAQLVRLTVLQGEERRIAAEKALYRVEYIPTRRGNIYDRNGTLLAADNPGYDIAVSYEVLTGEWAYRQARLEAEQTYSQQWREIGEAGRERLIAEFLPNYEAQIEQMWQVLSDLSQVEREEIDERRRSINAWVQQQANHIWEARRRKRMEELDEYVPQSSVAEPIAEQKMSHAVVFDVQTSALSQIRSFQAEALGHGEYPGNPAQAVWKEVKVERARRREIFSQNATVILDRSTLPSPLRSDEPLEIEVDGIALHHLGKMRQVWREDVTGENGRPFLNKNPQGEWVVDLGGYQPGDMIGQWGIERSQEARLRGLRGRVTRHLDTGKEERVEPVSGQDVYLSIDIQLQARIRALMDPSFGLMKRHAWHEKELKGPLGEPLNGAVVVLDIATGEILAGVNMPTFTLEELRDKPDSVIKDQLNRPFINRVVAQPYEPGSTVKPLVYAAAVSQGMIHTHHGIECTGHLDPGKPDALRCWIYKTYNTTHTATLGRPLSASDAICHSCNIYFYTLGRNLGLKRITQWYERFGMGQSTNSGMIEEVGGDLPHSDFGENAATQMGIGQGPVRWTPVQSVGAYAALARGGYWVSPTFLVTSKTPHVQETRDLRLDPRSIEEAMDGLWRGVNTNEGTGHHLNFDGQREKVFNVEGVRLYGKTGTAEATPLRIDSDGDDRITSRDQVVQTGDHAWCVLLVQKPGSSRPDYVVSVVVEYAGSGGKVSGPIANQVLHAMRAEGYF